MLAMAFLDDESSARPIKIAALCFGCSWLLWLAGTFAWLLLRWGRRRRLDCHLLGALLSFLLPIASLALIMRGLPVIAPSLTKAGPILEIPIDAALGAGLLGIPFGLAGGWILWQVGFPTAAAAAAENNKFSRSQHVLDQRRALFAIFLMPLLPVATVFVLLLYLANQTLPVESFAALTAWTASTWVALAMGGLAFLHVVSRGGHGIGRASCFACGGGAAFLLPGVFWLAGTMLGWLVAPIGALVADMFSDHQSVFSNIALLALIGTFLLPLGLLGGWLLWRIGIRPSRARPTPSSTATIFD